MIAGPSRLVDRLVCALRGHQVTRVIEGARLVGSDQFGLTFAATRMTRKCRRCGRVL